MGYEIRKNGYWPPKGQEQQTISKKVPKGLQNLKNQLYFSNYYYKSPKFGKCLELTGTFTLEKCLWAMEFLEMSYSTPKYQKLAAKQ